MIGTVTLTMLSTSNPRICWLGKAFPGIFANRQLILFILCTFSDITWIKPRLRAIFPIDFHLSFLLALEDSYTLLLIVYHLIVNPNVLHCYVI